jgi:hypothetical protein
MATIGYINNNAGNIRNIGNFSFAGEMTTPSDTFRRFISMEYGYRALIKNLQAYINSGIDTPLKITRKWAPYGDGKNNPDNYARNIATWTGLDVNTPISANDIDSLKKMAYGISLQENGITPNQAQISGGADLLSISGPRTEETPADLTKKKNTQIFLIAGISVLLIGILYVQLRKK